MGKKWKNLGQPIQFATPYGEWLLFTPESNAGETARAYSELTR